MALLLSEDDILFKQQIESCDFSIPDFDHRAHVRLAYVYLTENNPDVAIVQMKAALLGLLKHAGIDPDAKYHETLTKAWLLAVNHFMQSTTQAESADSFIDQNPSLLDSSIMLSHYSAELLFSEPARADFIEPDVSPIPIDNH